MQLKVKVDNKWVEIPATTEIADDIISDKLTYSSKKIEELVNNSGHKYSTDEQVVGTWIDGRPIYQKTITINESIDMTTKSFIHNIQNMDITIDVKSALYNENKNYMMFGNTYIDYIISDVNCKIYIIVNRNSVDIYRTSVPSVEDIPKIGYITLQYVKTTDVIPQDVTE